MRAVGVGRLGGRDYRGSMGRTEAFEFGSRPVTTRTRVFPSAAVPRVSSPARLVHRRGPRVRQPARVAKRLLGGARLPRDASGSRRGARRPRARSRRVPTRRGQTLPGVCPDQIPRRMLRARPGGGVGNGTVARRRGAQLQESAGGPRGGKSSQKVSDSSTGRRLHRRTNRRPETWVRLNRLEGRAASACAAESRGPRTRTQESKLRDEGMMPSTLNTHTKVKTFWKDEMKIESELGFLVPSWQIPHKKPGHVRILGIHSRTRTHTFDRTHTPTPPHHSENFQNGSG